MPTLTAGLQGKTGAANRTRTCDPVITNDVLYQLSYCGFGKSLKTLARRAVGWMREWSGAAIGFTRMGGSDAAAHELGLVLPVASG